MGGMAQMAGNMTPNYGGSGGYPIQRQVGPPALPRPQYGSGGFMPRGFNGVGGGMDPRAASQQAYVDRYRQMMGNLPPQMDEYAQRMRQMQGMGAPGNTFRGAAMMDPRQQQQMLMANRLRGMWGAAGG